MKSPILTAILLMSALTTFAQTSRRTYSDNKSTDNNGSTVSQDRRSSSTNNNTNTVNQDRRSSTDNNGSTVSQDRRSSSTNNNNNNTNTVNQEKRSSSDNTGNTVNQRVYSNQPGNSSASYRREPSSSARKNDEHRAQQREASAPRNIRSEHAEHAVRIENGHRGYNGRHTVVNYHYVRPTEARRVSYGYRCPVRTEIIWSVSMCRNYKVYYPEVHEWRYHTGYRIPSIAAYDAWDYVGEVANVYGKVKEVYYEVSTDEFFLYFGDLYPYHDFSMIIPGREAREITNNPVRYFENQHLAATGYIGRFDGRPEMKVRRIEQINVY